MQFFINSTLLFTQVSETFTNVVTYVCIAILVLIALVFSCFYFIKGKNTFNTTDIVYGGVCIALSFTLSFLKFTPVTYGGSVTIASLVPILLYSYYFKSAKGLLIGLIYGLLQFIQAPYILTFLTFILDYLLAFGCVCLMSIPKIFIKNDKIAIITGGTLVYLVRFIFHFISGVIYFEMGAIWAELPASSGAIYSFLYQAVYLIPDYLICLVAFILILNSKAINYFKPKNR